VYLADAHSDKDNGTLLTPPDSLKSIAVNRYFIADTYSINTAFIDTLVQLKLAQEKNIGYSFTKRLSTAWQIASPAILKNAQYLMLCALMVIFALFSKATRTRVLIFFAAYWLFIFIIAYVVKMEDRHYIYLSQVALYCALLMLLPAIPQLAKLPAALGLSALLGMAIFLMVNNHNRRARILANHALFNQFEADINQLAQGKILLLDGTSKDIFTSSPFHTRLFPLVKKIYFYDMGHLPLLPDYNNYLNAQCRCNALNAKEFYTAMAQKGNDILIISTAQRQQFISQYMDVVYGYRYHPTPLQGARPLVRNSESGELLLLYQF
jgi:hypothetical protein